MDDQIQDGASSILHISEKRGEHYPTRKDTIMTLQDRGEWIELARDIMTKGGSKLDNISKIAGSGSGRVEILKSFLPKKPQRSLWNILICIIQSTKKEEIISPTVLDLDKFFEELEPAKLSPSLARFGSPQVQPVLTVQSIIPRMSQRSAHILARTNNTARTQDIQEDTQTKSGEILSNSMRNNLQVLPDMAHIMEISKTSREDLWAFYGYKGAPHDPASPESYDEKMRKTYDDIARIRNAKKTAVCVSVSLGCKKLRELGLEGKEKIETTILPSPISPSIQTSQVTIPVRFQKRRIPTPIPRETSSVPLGHTGKTEQTNVQTRGARVVQSPSGISVQHTHISKPEFSFQDLVEQSTESRMISKKTPETPEENPVQYEIMREIPDFISYRAALEWGQKQEDWLWSINLWSNSTPKLQRDDLSVLAFLHDSNQGQLQVFLNKARLLSGNTRLKYTRIFEELATPLQEEKVGITDIQKNPHWMRMVQNVFACHASKQYANVMIQLSDILSDELLGGAVFDCMSEYGTSDYMDILALIVGANWTQEEGEHYLSRTIKDVLRYKKGNNTDLDRVFSEGPHVKQKIFKETLQSIIFNVPLGEKQWPRYREYDTPAVTLYDVVIEGVRKEGGDTTSSKTLFHKLDELIL